jgi:hypothetical protein
MMTTHNSGKVCNRAIVHTQEIETARDYHNASRRYVERSIDRWDDLWLVRLEEIPVKLLHIMRLSYEHTWFTYSFTEKCTGTIVESSNSSINGLQWSSMEATGMFCTREPVSCGKMDSACSSSDLCRGLRAEHTKPMTRATPP